MKTVFLLGADDPEMRAMEKMLKKAGKKIAYASISGTRVHPGQAYRADTVSCLKTGDTLVRVECEPVSIQEGVKVVSVDHHRFGDHGYDLGPEQYWEAASIGQLCRLLLLEPTDGWMRLAAMDHCFSAAVWGKCPGVSCHEVLLVGVAEIAAKTKTGHARVIQQIHNFSILLKEAPELVIGDQSVKDFRGRYLGEGYSLDLLTAQIAAAIGGHVALLRHRDREGVSEKYSLVGHSKPETVQAFIDEWAPAQGLVRVYGVPVRGYAGGYLK